MENRSFITIRPLEKEEIPLLSRLAASAYLDHFRYLWFDEGNWYVEKCFSEAALTSEYHIKGNRFFLILDHHEEAGFLKLKIPTVDVCRNCLELERIYLRKKLTGMGIGRYCMKWFEGLAREEGYRELLLKAMDSSTDSIAFYKKSGFVISGKTVLDFELMKEVWRGMVVMKKIIR